MSSGEVLARLESLERALVSGDRPMSFKEAAGYLTCSPSYLYKLTHRRLIPCFKPLGKKLYFKRSDLENFLLQKPKKTIFQIEREALLRKAAA